MRLLQMTAALWLIFTSASVGAVSNNETEPSAKIDQLLRTAFPADAPGAAVLVTQNGQVLLRKGYGMANLELGLPADSNNVFRICSITKQFTAVAILQLVEAGKVRLDDDIHQYVPDYPTGDAKVTLAELLAHTSGIPSIESQSEWAAIWRNDMTVPELLALTKNKPLNFKPGTDFKYSNTGYVLLGAVIEKTSGQSYADYIQSHIFAPVGMTNSYYDAANRVISHRVPGYTREGKQWGNAPYISMTQPYSAGSLLSTVDDLWNWEQSLESGKLVGAELLAQAQTAQQLPDGRSTNYGFGWEIDRLSAHVAVQHGGGMPGFCAHELKIPDAGIFVVILCNESEPAESPRSLAGHIARLLLNEAESETGTIAPAVLEDYVGKYRVAPGQDLEITVVDGKLIGRLGGNRPLHSVGVDTFATPDNEMRLTFLRNADHKVDRVLARPDAPGPGMTWHRE